MIHCSAISSDVWESHPGESGDIGGVKDLKRNQELDNGLILDMPMGMTICICFGCTTRCKCSRYTRPTAMALRTGNVDIATTNNITIASNDVASNNCGRSIDVASEVVAPDTSTSTCIRYFWSLFTAICCARRLSRGFPTCKMLLRYSSHSHDHRHRCFHHLVCVCR